MSIKYMRGPWRGGNLPFIHAKERKKKENTDGRPPPFSATSVGLIPSSRKENKKEINLKQK